MDTYAIIFLMLLAASIGLGIGNSLRRIEDMRHIAELEDEMAGLWAVINTQHERIEADAGDDWDDDDEVDFWLENDKLLKQSGSHQ